MLNKLENFKNSKSKKKIKGRGPGSTLGKTCGKGHKGQNSRSGKSVRIGFEGGQMPLYRRLPKRGFTTFKKELIQIINLDKILQSKIIDFKSTITKEILYKAKLIKNINLPIKILGNGNVNKPIVISSSGIDLSFNAKNKIETKKGFIK